MTKWVDAVLTRFGVGIVRVPGRNFDRVLQDVFASSYAADTGLVFVDVGAHYGESIQRFKRIARGHPSRIYSFEAAASLFQKLQNQYGGDATVELFNFAVGSNKGVVQFNFHETSTGSSSVIPFDESSRFALRRNLKGHVQVQEVPSISLDRFVAERAGLDRIHVLKIDVQGYEEEVFQGAVELIGARRVDIVEVEVILGRAYKRNTSFLSVEKFLAPHGYRMIAASPDGRFAHGRALDLIRNPELQFDAIYVAPHIFEKL